MVRGSEPVISFNPYSNVTVEYKIMQAGLYVVVETSIGMYTLCYSELSLEQILIYRIYHSVLSTVRLPEAGEGSACASALKETSVSGKVRKINFEQVFSFI